MLYQLSYLGLRANLASTRAALSLFRNEYYCSLTIGKILSASHRPAPAMLKQIWWAYGPLAPMSGMNIHSRPFGDKSEVPEVPPMSIRPTDMNRPFPIRQFAAETWLTLMSFPLGRR